MVRHDTPWSEASDRSHSLGSEIRAKTREEDQLDLTDCSLSFSCSLEIQKQLEFFIRRKQSRSPVLLVLIETRRITGMLHGRNHRWLQSSRVDILPADRGEEGVFFHFTRTVSTGAETFVRILIEKLLDERLARLVDRLRPGDAAGEHPGWNFVLVLIGIERCR